MSDRATGQHGGAIPPSANNGPSRSSFGSETGPSASAASATAGPSSSGSRYIPQFSAATQMILKRIKTEGVGAKSMSPQPEIKSEMKAEFNASTYEDVRRRVIMGMSTTTSMTMQMPTTTMPRSVSKTQPSTVMSVPLAPLTLQASTPSITQQPPPTSASQTSARVDARPKVAAGAAGLSAIRRITMGLSASGRPIVTKEAKVKSTSTTKASKTPHATKPVKRPVGRPRKNINQEDEASSSSSLSELSDLEDLTIDQVSTTPIATTKSGRQILKPTTYNPAAMGSSSSKKRVYSKTRTTEQALCKLCTRMASPDWNQIVFCDGCNDPWHQQCHDPWIPDELVKDSSKTWYCSTCQAKRDHQTNSKKQRVVSTVTVPTKVAWTNAPAQQKRAYLSSLSQQDLVGLIMGVLETTHPDLPIFPGETTTTRTTSSTPVTPRSAQSQNKKSLAATSVTVADEDDDEEQDEMTRAWPKPGLGPFNAQLRHFVKEHPDEYTDFESFSQAVYAGGKKVWENGAAVVA